MQSFADSLSFAAHMNLQNLTDAPRSSKSSFVYIYYEIKSYSLIAAMICYCWKLWAKKSKVREKLKLKVSEFWRLITTFIELTVEKDINGEGAFWTPPPPPILNRVKHLPKVGAEISSSKTVAPKFSIPRKLDLEP